MWLVLCDSDDYSALWAYAQLRDRGLQPLELVSPSMILCSRSISHRIGGHGASFEICLQDGRELLSGNIKGVLNRWCGYTVDHLAGMGENDLYYAAEELSAFMLSLLASVGSVINRPDPRGIAGALRSKAEWYILAARAGLSLPSMHFSSRCLEFTEEAIGASLSIIIFETRIFGEELPIDIAQACARLSRLADTNLLGVEFFLDPSGHLIFGSATPLPDLRIGGKELIEELHRRFEGSA